MIRRTLAHGEQEHIRYDGYYGGYCFLPLHVYEGLSGRLIPTIFKAKRFTGTQMLAVLKRLVKHLRHAWADTLIVFRGDSHFAYPEVMQWIEAQAHLHYVTGLTSNNVLQTLRARGGRAGQMGLWARWRQGHPLPLDMLSGRNVVAAASGGDQG